MADPRLPSMSRTESLVMELLRGRERYGLELVDASRRRAQARLRLRDPRAHGRERLRRSRQEERAPGTSGLPRRLYRATPYGRKVHGAFATAARRAGPQTDGGAMSFESGSSRSAERFLSRSHLRADRRAGAGRSGVRGGRPDAAAGWPIALARAPGGRRRAWRRRRARLGGFFELTLLSVPLLHVSDRRSASTSFKTWPSSSSSRRWSLGCRWCRCMVCFWPERRTAPPID